MAQAQNALAIHNQLEKRRSVTYSTDRENKVSKIHVFIISLRLIECAGKETFVFSGPYSELWPAKLTNHTTHTN